MAETAQEQSVEMKDINKVIAKLECSDDIDLPRYQALATALIAREVCALREMFDISLPGPGATIETFSE